MKKFPARLAVQQRVLPFYRVPFFELLADACEGGLTVFAGEPRSKEHIVTATSLRNIPYKTQKNIHLFGGSFYLCYQPNLLNWLVESDPAALILEANPRYPASTAAIGWMRARKRPVVGWGLGAPLRTGAFSGVQQKIWKRFLGRFDALIAYSQRGAAEYAACGIPSERIFVAHNAVAPKPQDAMPKRAETKDADLPLTILFVGRLQARKKLDGLIRACAALSHRVRLWIVGEGAIRTDLEKLAEDVFPSTRFFGEKHGADLQKIWQAADIFVLPGTGGLAVQEAMAHALPVIVAAGDGTQADLVRPENGWLLPADDENALLAALEDALSDLPRLRRMGRESWRIVAEEVNIEKMTAVFLSLLRKLL